MEPPRIPDHVLLRRIGRGSYGEVWLARNALGTFRAVKLVSRAAFDSARPYEREFAGIQRYEPVSRSHDGLVDILQVGHTDDGGGFYYVMELADPVDPPLDPATYQPRTLAADLRRRGRLPTADSLPLFLGLAAGLGHLHHRGLVHRDIKPSNIIFVNGVAKLADIGLVAECTEAASHVGTEGFIAPEGAGTRTADVYSLGKVLYEAATGLDRTQFPSLPLERHQVAEFADLLELNAVMLKACAPDPRQRYQTAEELASDLAFLQSGRSVKRQRLVEKHLRRARRVLAAAAFLTALALLASVFSRARANREHQLRQRAETAELEAREQLRRARINEARALRRGTEAGRRSRALAALAEAARVRIDHELRSEAAACLALTDLRPLPDGPAVEPGTAALWAPGMDRYAVARTNGSITLHDARSGQTTLSLPVPPDRLPDRLLTFSPGGRWLLAAYGQGTTALWDTRPGTAPTRPAWSAGFEWFDNGFSDDDRWAVFAEASGTLHFVDLLDFHETTRATPIPRVTAQLNADGSLLALAGIRLPAEAGTNAVDRTVLVQRRDSGEPVLSLPFSRPVNGIVWVDASRLAVLLSDGTIRVQDVTGFRPEILLAGHQSTVTEFGALPGSDWFLTSCWDGFTRLFELQSGSEFLRLPYLAYSQFGSDLRQLGGLGEPARRLVRFEVLGGRVVSSLLHARTDRDKGPWDGSFDRTSRWFSSTDTDGTRVWAVDDPAHPLVVPPGVLPGNGFFDPDADALYLPTTDGRFERRPWTIDNQGTWRLGDANFAATGSGILVASARPGGIAWIQPDREHATVHVRRGEHEPILTLHADRGETPPLPVPVGYRALSPDARQVALSPPGEKRSYVLDVETPGRFQELPTHDQAYVAFTPDGRRLLLGDPVEYRLWDLTGRTNVWLLPRTGSGNLSGRQAISPDGSVCALALDRWTVVLVATTDGSELLRLEHPRPEMISNLHFSPDGRHLAVFNETHVIHLWDLDRLRRELAELGFGWEPGLAALGREKN